VSIRNSGSGSTSPRSGVDRLRNGKKCPRCKRFGTFAPNSLVCDRCLGALPLIFRVTVTVVIVGGDRW
jgi:hypothetical protein